MSVLYIFSYALQYHRWNIALLTLWLCSKMPTNICLFAALYTYFTGGNLNIKFYFSANKLANSHKNVVSFYWVYCWKIIQQRMLVVDNFHVKIRYTYIHFFSYVFQKLYWFHAIKLSKCPKNTFGMWNTQYSI